MYRNVYRKLLLYCAKKLMNILYLEKVNHYAYIIHAFIYNFQKTKWLIFSRVIKISMEKKDIVLHKEFFSQI